ncbi:MAG TPA: acyl-ACP thioesterase domain-containing protein [Spirochaetia bacterium]|nr:acyl-ACP thioesterase domain-containing protein [Spirochaetia bacterium]
MARLLQESSFTVQLFDTDIHGTLSVRGLWDFLQETAGNHTQALGVAPDDLRKRGLAWILSRLRLAVERYPALGESVTVRTWPSGVDRLFALRDFTMSGADGSIIARAVSAWLALDLASKRPLRIQSVFDRPALDAPRALSTDLEKLSGPAAAASELRFPVRFGDLDANRHVSNSRYVEWVVESAGPALLDNFSVSSLGVDFLAEMVFGGEVIVRTGPGGEARPGAAPKPGTAEQTASDSRRTLDHAVVHGGNGTEAARARTEWRPL